MTVELSYTTEWFTNTIAFSVLDIGDTVTEATRDATRLLQGQL